MIVSVPEKNTVHHEAHVVYSHEQWRKWFTLIQRDHFPVTRRCCKLNSRGMITTLISIRAPDLPVICTPTFLFIISLNVMIHDIEWKFISSLLLCHSFHFETKLIRAFVRCHSKRKQHLLLQLCGCLMWALRANTLLGKKERHNEEKKWKEPLEVQFC